MSEYLTEPGMSIHLPLTVAKYVIVEEFCANCGRNKCMGVYTYLIGCSASGKLPWYKRIGSPRLYERDHVWRETRRESSVPY